MNIIALLGLAFHALSNLTIHEYGSVNFEVNFSGNLEIRNVLWMVNTIPIDTDTTQPGIDAIFNMSSTSATLTLANISSEYHEDSVSCIVNIEIENSPHGTCECGEHFIIRIING